MAKESAKKKGFFGKLIDKMDKKIEDESKKKCGCECDCEKKKKK